MSSDDENYECNGGELEDPNEPFGWVYDSCDDCIKCNNYRSPEYRSEYSSEKCKYNYCCCNYTKEKLTSKSTKLYVLPDSGILPNFKISN